MNTIQDLLQELYDKGLEFSMRPDYWRHAVILEVRKRDGVHVLAKSLHELRPVFSMSINYSTPILPMNIKLLRKLRKRYKYYWTQVDGRHVLHVLDTKAKWAEKYPDVLEFLSDYVFWTFGFSTGADFKRRICRRKNRVAYYEGLKHLTHKSP
jgi:hypothetical protein